MKIFLIISVIFFPITSYSTTTNNIKVTFEDTLQSPDTDSNDIVMCTNWTWSETNSDISKVEKVTLSITPVAAGTSKANSIYIKNPCNGPGLIELKKFEDGCSDPITQQAVSAKGDLVKLTDSFTNNAFSSQCSLTDHINTNSTVEICTPNKTYVVISCDQGAEFSTNNGIFPYGEIFYIDPLGDGVSGSLQSDDIDTESAQNSFASILISDCHDPVSEEGTNFIDSLSVKGSLSLSECYADGANCREVVKNAMISKRASGWENETNLKLAHTPTGHGVSFSALNHIESNLFVV